MTSPPPRFSVAGTFLEGLAAQDVDHLASALHDDVHLRALVPAGLREWHGPAEVRAAFHRWFGEVEAFELVDATVGEVGGRLHLRWRVRVIREPGAGWSVVEQQAYADTGGDDRIEHLALLCSGFRAEAGDA